MPQLVIAQDEGGALEPLGDIAKASLGEWLGYVKGSGGEKAGGG